MPLYTRLCFALDTRFINANPVINNTQVSNQDGLVMLFIGLGLPTFYLPLCCHAAIYRIISYSFVVIAIDCLGHTHKQDQIDFLTVGADELHKRKSNRSEVRCLFA